MTLPSECSQNRSYRYAEALADCSDEANCIPGTGGPSHIRTRAVPFYPTAYENDCRTPNEHQSSAGKTSGLTMSVSSSSKLSKRLSGAEKGLLDDETAN